MDPVLLLTVGCFLTLIGFLSLVKSRVVAVRRRLTSAASIRSHGSGGSAAGYQSRNAPGWRVIGIGLMLAGGAAMVAAMAVG